MLSRENNNIKDSTELESWSRRLTYFLIVLTVDWMCVFS